MSAPVTLTTDGNKCVNSDVDYDSDSVTSSGSYPTTAFS